MKSEQPGAAQPTPAEADARRVAAARERRAHRRPKRSKGRGSERAWRHAPLRTVTQTTYERMDNVATELSNSDVMNALIRGGKAPRRQEPNTELPEPDAVVAAVAKLAEELPDDELERFRERIVAALYGEDADSAGAAS